jgi:hypothetical protein
MRSAMAEQTSSPTIPALLSAFFAFAATGCSVLLLSGQPAAADTCIDQVRALARQHALDSTPPTVAPGGKGDVRTQDLARSGGVIAPPPVQDKSIVAPAQDKHDPMPTVPDVTSKKQQDGSEAERSGLQAALVAARAQAERGDEKGCQEALARARVLAERAKGG